MKNKKLYIFFIMIFLFHIFLLANEKPEEKYFKAGLYKLENENYIGAIQDYTKAIEINPLFAKAYHYRGLSKSQLKDYVGAMQDYMKALELNPNNASLYCNIGSAYYLIGKYRKAIEYHEIGKNKLVELFGENNMQVVLSYIDLGGAYRDLNKFKNAFRSYDKALEIQSKISDAKNVYLGSIYGLIYEGIGSTYEILSNLGEALKNFKKSLSVRIKYLGENNKEVAMSYLNIGRIYSRLNKFSDAINFSNKALKIQLNLFGELHDEVSRTYDSLGTDYSNIDNFDKAINYYQKSLDIKIKLYGKAHNSISTSFKYFGSLYERKGQFLKALEYFEKSLSIDIKVFEKNNQNIANSYIRIGRILLILDKCSAAILNFEKANNILINLFGNFHKDVAFTYNNLGMCYERLGNYSKSLVFYNKELKIKNSIYSVKNQEIAETFSSIGNVYYKIGDYNNALKKFKKALNIYLSLKFKTKGNLANLYARMGSLFLDIRSYRNSIKYNKLALNTYIESHGAEHSLVSSMYRTLSSFYFNTGNYKKSLEILEKSLNILKKVFFEENEQFAQTYNMMALIFNQLNRPNMTLKYTKKALSINKKFFGENHSNTGRSYWNLGFYYMFLLKNNDEALNYFKKSLDIFLKIKDNENIALTYYYIAIVHDFKKNYEKSITLFKKCIKIYQDLRSKIKESNTRINLAHTYIRIKKKIKAISELEKAIKIKDEVRFALKEEELKTSFFKTYQDAYRLLFKLIYEEAKEKSSFKISEKSKSVVFADMMAKKGARDKIAGKNEGFRSLLKKETLLLHRIRRTEQTMKQKKDEKLKTLIAKLGDLYNKLTSIQDKMKKEYPEYSELLYPKEVAVEELQKLLTDEETYLSYYMLENYTVVFLISKNDFISYKIDLSQKFIEDKIFEMRQKIENCRKQSSYDYPELSRLFYESLFKPFESKIKTKKIIISADGTLYGFPFEALVMNIPKIIHFEGQSIPYSDIKKYQTKKKLPSFYEYSQMEFPGDKYIISYIPSASSLKVIRKSSKRSNKKTDGVLAIADPIFSEDDPRVSNPQKKNEYHLKGQLLVQSKAVRKWPPKRLPQTAIEAKMFTSALGGGKLLLGNDATEENVFKTNISHSKYLLFSTHGILGNESSAKEKMEPAIVLSLVGNPEEYDGFLEMSEAAGLNLNCDLVILSACNSAGESGRGGEGFAGMARSFIFAGSNGVIATHWKIESEATKDFMILLAGELKSKNGLIALRNSKNKFRKQIKKYGTENVCMAHPFFWSAFVYLGD